MSTITKEQSRFNARLPKEQKELFEKAVVLGGYRNLTDFVMFAAREKAKEIIQEKEQIISSARDSKIFFEAVTKPQKPNAALGNALEYYKAFIAKSK